MHRQEVVFFIGMIKECLVVNLTIVHIGHYLSFQYWVLVLDLRGIMLSLLIDIVRSASLIGLNLTSLHTKFVQWQAQ